MVDGFWATFLLESNAPMVKGGDAVGVKYNSRALGTTSDRRARTFSWGRSRPRRPSRRSMRASGP
eukprot:1651510-Alexandrium_andersonii.AAC.1